MSDLTAHVRAPKWEGTDRCQGLRSSTRPHRWIGGAWDDGDWRAAPLDAGIEWTHSGTAPGSTPTDRLANARAAVEAVLRAAGVLHG